MRASATTSSKYFTTSDGVKMHYIERGTGTPFVLLPGWTQPALGFAAQIESLSASFRCLALDFLGHGESERPAYGYRVNRLAKNCLHFLNHLRRRNAVLLGHSAGCTVTLDHYKGRFFNGREYNRKQGTGMVGSASPLQSSKRFNAKGRGFLSKLELLMST